MSMDRFDEVTIGHACEVEGCSIVCAPNENRCYDHSVMRLIGSLFNGSEICRFNGVNCTYQATVCNENDVPMCEQCHHVYRRIQRGRYYEGRTITQLVGPHNELIRDAMMHPVVPLVPLEEELGEERDVCWGYIGPCDNYAVTTVAHPSDGGQVPMCSHCADRSFFTMSTPHFDSLASMLGIPPMRRDEGEETE